MRVLGHECLENFLVRPTHPDELYAKSIAFGPSHSGEFHRNS
jgi:hypothetical protein